MKERDRLWVLIVEDDAIIAEDLVNCIEDLGHITLGPAYSLSEAKRLFLKRSPDIALLDIHLERADDGIRLASWIQERFTIPLIFLTAYSDEKTIAKVKHVYPAQFLVKPFNMTQLKLAIEISANNFYHSDPDLEAMRRILRLNQRLHDPLTKREIDVLINVWRGMNNKQIAETLYVSQNTIKTHLKHIFIKTNASSRAEVVGKLHSI